MQTGFYGKANNLLLSHPTYAFIRFQAHSTHPPKWRGSEYASQVNKELTWRNFLIFWRCQHYFYGRGKHRMTCGMEPGQRTLGINTMRKLVASEVWIYSKSFPLGAASCSWLGVNPVLWTLLVPHGGDVEEELDHSTPAQRLPREEQPEGFRSLIPLSSPPIWYVYKYPV